MITDKAHDYLIEEMSVLRQELDLILEKIDSLERFAILATGAVWSLVASLKWNEVINIIIYLPAIISFLFLIKNTILVRKIKQIDGYIKELENFYSLPSIKLGWTNFYSNRKKQETLKGSLRWWGYIFWFTLIIGNILIAILFPFSEVLPK